MGADAQAHNHRLTWSSDGSGRLHACELRKPAELRLPELSLVVMGVNMAVPMAAWMRVRRHPWSRSIEMGGAMFAPGIPLLVLFWFGVLAYSAVCGVWCGTMIAAMLALMLYRRRDYLHLHGNMR